MTGQNHNQEDRLSKKWPPLSETSPYSSKHQHFEDEDKKSWIIVDQPATIVDSKGRILAWILPDIVASDIQVRFVTAQVAH